MEFIEVSAKTVDDAITKACIELQAASDKLEIQVISEYCLFSVPTVTS